MTLPQKLTVEFIGTFFLVFAVCMAAGQEQPLAAIAIGTTLMAMVFAGGHISGAHYNPAVSLAVWARGRLEGAQLLPYIAAQLAGAACAALVVLGLGYDSGSVAHVAAAGKMLVAEFLFTFALAYVVLNVATARGTDGNSFYGLAIGLTVTAGAITVGPVSGGAFNPAVAFGAMVDGLLRWEHIWVYLLADMAAGLAAARLFLFVQTSEKPAGDLQAADAGT